AAARRALRAHEPRRHPHRARHARGGARRAHRARGRERRPAQRAAGRRLARGARRAVIARARYLLLTSARTRTPLAPLAVTVFWAFGTFFYPNNEVGGTGGQTGVTCWARAGWLVGAILAGEPQAQAEMATTAIGGLRGRLGLEGLLVLMVAPFLALPFLAWP